MSFQKMISNVAAYNLWANETLVNWLRTKPEDQLQEEIASSYSGILKTLNHIWAVEQFWQMVISNAGWSGEARYSATEFHAEEILPGLVAQSKSICETVQSLSEEALSEVVNVDFPWVKGAQPRYELILHAFNHSTYHRGQVTSIGRRLGYTDAPMTDYNFYNMVAKVPQVS